MSKDSIEKNYNDLEIMFGLKKQLIEAFGMNSDYVSVLEEKGLKKFIEYVYKKAFDPELKINPYAILK